MVAGALRTRILSGELADGAMLPKQDELLEEFGVSLPPIREALRILETEGLITVQRGNVGGAVVHAPQESKVVYMMGLVLQSPAGAARRACSTPSPRSSRRAPPPAPPAPTGPRPCCRCCGPRSTPPRPPSTTPPPTRAWPASSTSTSWPTAATRPCASSSGRSSRSGPCTSTTWPGATSSTAAFADLAARKASAREHEKLYARIEKGDVRGAELVARAHYASAEPGWGESVDTDAVVSADLLEGR